MTGWELCKWLSELPAEQKNLPVYVYQGQGEIQLLETDALRVTHIEEDIRGEGDELVQVILLGDS